jgi:hypothetical protein
VQIMARAGYDPRALGRMFETIARESKGGGGNPQWLSSHPDPGNRTQYINKEAEALPVTTPANEAEFAPIKTAFGALPPAMSMADIGRAKPTAASGAAPSTGTPGQPVSAPSSEYKEVRGGGVFQSAVPADWVTIPSRSAIKAVPQNGYGPVNGQTVFTHGVEFGVLKAASRDLQEATKAWLNAVAQSNPELRLGGQQQALRISQRSAIATPLLNPSPLGGQEQVTVYTTFLADGTLFYYLTIVPEKEAAVFDGAFRRILESIRLTEVNR